MLTISRATKMMASANQSLAERRLVRSVTVEAYRGSLRINATVGNTAIPRSACEASSVHQSRATTHRKAHANLAYCLILHLSLFNPHHDIVQSVSLFAPVHQSNNAKSYWGSDAFVEVIEPYVWKMWPLMTRVYVWGPFRRESRRRTAWPRRPTSELEGHCAAAPAIQCHDRPVVQVVEAERHSARQAARAVRP